MIAVNKGDIVILLGETKEELGGSEYLKTIFNLKSGKAPSLDLKKAKVLNNLLVRLAKESFLESAHDCSEGGLSVALAESCILERGREIGAVTSLPYELVSKPAFFFGESQSRVIISVSPKNLKAAEDVINSYYQYPYKIAGTVGGQELRINDLIRVPLEVLSHTWRNSIKRRMEI